MARKLAFSAVVLFLVAGTVSVVWTGLNWPPPEWLLGFVGSPEEEVLASSDENILGFVTDGTVLWSRTPGGNGGPPVGPTWGGRPPRAIRAALASGSGFDAVSLSSGTVLGRLCHPLGLDWGKAAQVMVWFF